MAIVTMLINCDDNDGDDNDDDDDIDDNDGDVHFNDVECCAVLTIAHFAEEAM